MTFKEWIEQLYEAKYEFNFRKGQDQDYTGSPDEVLVFSEKEPDEYQVRGKTHGQMSHAIKHLREFEPEYVKSVLDKARNVIFKFLQRRPQYFCKIWSETRGFSEYSGMEALNHCDSMSLLNTLDIVNDKNQTKTPFTKIDGQLKQFGSELEKRYNEIISKKINSAYNLDKQRDGDYKRTIAKNQIISFSAISRNGKGMNVWLDFKDGSIIIGNKSNNGEQEIRTMYRLNNAGTNKKSIIKQFYTKGLKPSNPDIDKALSGI